MAATFQVANPALTATSSGVSVDLGINAHFIKLISAGASDFYVSFNGVTATTSASFRVTTGANLEIRLTEKQGFITEFSARAPTTNNATINYFAFGKAISS